MTEPQPHLLPTRGTTLVMVALVGAALGWSFARMAYDSLPALPWFGSAALLALAVAEFALGRHTRARLERREGTEPVEPLLVARYAALAKASSLAGAAYFGVFAGVGVWLLRYPSGVEAVESDLPIVGLALAAGALLVAGALFLEYACRIPPSSDDDGGPSRPDADPNEPG